MEKSDAECFIFRNEILVLLLLFMSEKNFLERVQRKRIQSILVCL